MSTVKANRVQETTASAGVSVDDIRAYGPVFNVRHAAIACAGDGATDDRAKLDTLANTTIPATGGTILFPPGTYKLSSAITFPKYVTLMFLAGATLAPDTGITATLNASVAPTFQKIFGGLGNVVFGAGPRVERVLPQWWGATGDGTTDDSGAINKAILSLAGTGGRVYFVRPSGTYYIGTTTINVAVEGIILEASDTQTYIKYAGTGYAISFSLAGAAQQNNCGMWNLGVVCTNPSGGSAVYMKSPFSCFIEHGYFENAITANTGVGITLDGGSTAGGTGYFGTNTLIRHVRCYGFLKGVLFKSGTLAGWDIMIGCKVEECFISSLVGLTGSVGVEWQGAQQCVLLGGNIEQVDTGLKMVSGPSACIGNIIDHTRFEATAVNNWLIPADSTNTSIINPRWQVDNGSDLALDTVLIQNTLGRFPPHNVQYKSLGVAAVNGDNNHTLSRGSASYVRITGPGAAFAVGGFSITPKTAALTDGMELFVYNATAFAMTINNADGAATASCGIRTPTGANVVQTAGSGGSSARFVYDSVLAAWILTQWTT